MPVRSDAVGAVLAERVVTVSARQVLAYSAGLGVDDARLLDDTREELAALPQFCVSLEWPVVSDPSARTRLGLEPSESLRGVHVAQDSRFHAPIRPGMSVRTRGRYAAVRATRAGALVHTLLETTDDVTAAPLVTSWSASIYRDVSVEGPDRADLTPPEPSRESTRSRGDEPAAHEEVEIPVRRGLAHVYSECAAIWNPIHTERAVALRAGLPDIILHGTATWALAGTAVATRRADGDPLRLRRLAGRFTAPVLPGSLLRIRVGPREETGGVAFDVVVPGNGGPTTVLAGGRAELAS